MRTTIAVLLVTAALTVSPDTAQRLEIIGAWTLNHDLSTKPPEGGDRLPEGRPQGAGGRGGFGGGGRGGGGFGGRGGGGGMGGATGQMSEGDRQKLQATIRRLRDAPERLTITHDGITVAFADGDGRTWKTTADGKKQTMLTGDGEIQIKAKIDGAQLIVEESIGGRGTLIYTYAPTEDAGTRRLSVKVKLEGGNSPRPIPEMTRVYDALEQ